MIKVFVGIIFIFLMFGGSVFQAENASFWLSMGGHPMAVTARQCCQLHVMTDNY